MTFRLALALSLVLAAAPAVPAAAAPGSGFSVQEDVQYGEADGSPLLLDAYVPDGGGGNRLAVIVVHGGRWYTGDKGDVPGGVFAELGSVAFSVDYRLAPEHPYPAAVQDVQTAVRWVRAHAGEYGVDPTRIWAIGGSAGGHLVGMLATLGSGARDQDARVAAAVSLSGPMDLELLADTSSGLERAVINFLGCSRWDDACRAVAREASPITHLDPSDAPIYLANSTEEPIPLNQATTMADAMAATPVPHQLQTIAGHDHAFAYLRTVLEPSIEFVDAHLDVAGGLNPPQGSVGQPGQPGSGGTITVPGSPREGEVREGSAPRGAARTGREEPGGSLGFVAFLIAALVAAAAALTLIVKGRASPGRPAT